MSQHARGSLVEARGGVTFSLSHTCTDDKMHDLYWEEHPGTGWVQCPRCNAGAKITVRWPDGRIVENFDD